MNKNGTPKGNKWSFDEENRKKLPNTIRVPVISKAKGTKETISLKKFIFNFWEEFLIKSNITLIDSKTKLQEFSLKKFKELPKYVFFKKTGPQHRPLFKTEVQIPNSKKIIGIGSSKKNAQQNAAAKLLKILNI